MSIKIRTNKKIAVIGAGFSGLSAASYLSKFGYEVTLFEKHDAPGGRARQYKDKGFTFDMGPTWYWMPDVYERFFMDFDKLTTDYYNVERLDPGYKVYFGPNDSIDISASLNDIYKVFEKEQAGSALFLKDFLNKAEFNYKAAMGKVVYSPGKSPLELITPATVKRVSQFFKSIKSIVRKGVKNPRLAQILEFPVLFLGARPEDTPAFYSFMNYSDMVQGTWFPDGGMYSVVKGFEKLARENGVRFLYNHEISNIVTNKNKVLGIESDGKYFNADVIVSGADYYHTEQLFQDKDKQNYNVKYWDSRVLSPSALLFYVGFNKKLKNISHHTLFFDAEFSEHAESIYITQKWPEKPLFYASFPSVTDSQCAPDDHEAAIFLIPLAPGIKDDNDIREKYFKLIMERFENITQQKVKDHVVLKRSYCIKDFKNDYNAFKGNAYGLSNILKQTAFLKPSLQNKKLKNMFYTGQLTVPGPGVPPTIISGKIVSGLVHKYLSSS